MKKIHLKFSALIPLILGFNFVSHALADQIPITTIVDGGLSQGKSLQCIAYLYIPEDQQFDPNNNFPLHFIQQGTGNYSIGSPKAKNIVDNQWFKLNGHNYLLMMDKPGISYDPTAQDDSKIDRNYYDYYTTGNLIECANNALIWAYGQKLENQNRPIIFYGHSEGSVVMTNLAYTILSYTGKPALQVLQLQNQLKGLFLSGVVMNSWADESKYQLNYPSEKYDTFIKNYNTGIYTQAGDDYFYQNFELGYYWFSFILNPTNPPAPIKALLDNILNTAKGSNLPIEIFQGLYDKNVDPQSVLDYEIKNNAKPVGKKLNIRARYYNAPHDPTPNELLDMGLSIKNDVK